MLCAVHPTGKAKRTPQAWWLHLRYLDGRCGILYLCCIYQCAVYTTGKKCHNSYQGSASAATMPATFFWLWIHGLLSRCNTTEMETVQRRSQPLPTKPRAVCCTFAQSPFQLSCTSQEGYLSRTGSLVVLMMFCAG